MAGLVNTAQLSKVTCRRPPQLLHSINKTKCIENLKQYFPSVSLCINVSLSDVPPSYLPSYHFGSNVLWTQLTLLATLISFETHEIHILVIDYDNNPWWYGTVCVLSTRPLRLTNSLSPWALFWIKLLIQNNWKKVCYYAVKTHVFGFFF